MKREKYLWPLSQSHHRALMAARRIREALSAAGPDSGPVTELTAEVKSLYDGELLQHFWDEERILNLFESHVGCDDPDARRIRREHRLLESLAFQGTGECLLGFADLIVRHIRFEEDVLFGRIEAVLTGAEQKATGDILEHPPPARDVGQPTREGGW